MSRVRTKWNPPTKPPHRVRAVKTRGGTIAVRHWGIFWAFNLRFIYTWGSLLVNYGPLTDVTGTPEGAAAIAEYAEYERERKKGVGTDAGLADSSS